MSIKRFCFIFCLCFWSVTAGADDQTCLSYLQVGDSGCDPVVSKTTVEEGGILPPPSLSEEEVLKVEEKPKPEIVQKEPEKALEERIDDFMDNYGKPPREFVAFNLEPTLENALKWAKKYREMMERNKKLTAAWGQAQTILNEMEGKGVEIPGYEPMPDVPDFGVGVPNGFQGFSSNLPSQKNDYAGIAANSNNRQGAPTIGFAEGDAGLSMIKRNDDSVINTSKSDLYGESLTPPAKEEDGPVEISYYFSAECPYCKKFEEDFKGLVKEMRADLKVVCVDMTPSERKKANIHGKIDCSWRAAIPGEAKALGVTSTPTLIINRKMGYGLEKVEGLVNMSKLRAFLRGEV